MHRALGGREGPTRRRVGPSSLQTFDARSHYLQIATRTRSEAFGRRELRAHRSFFAASSMLREIPSNVLTSSAAKPASRQWPFSRFR